MTLPILQLRKQKLIQVLNDLPSQGDIAQKQWGHDSDKSDSKACDLPTVPRCLGSDVQRHIHTWFWQMTQQDYSCRT